MAISCGGDDAGERSDEYRQRATECRELAVGLRNEGSREELLALANIWLSLADTPPSACR